MIILGVDWKVCEIRLMYSVLIFLFNFVGKVMCVMIGMMVFFCMDVMVLVMLFVSLNFRLVCMLGLFCFGRGGIIICIVFVLVVNFLRLSFLLSILVMERDRVYVKRCCFVGIVESMNVVLMKGIVLGGKICDRNLRKCFFVFLSVKYGEGR